MGDPPKPGGYLYREMLARAEHSNGVIVQVLDDLLDAPSERALSRLVAKGALAIAEQRDALARLREIWQEYRGHDFA